MKWFTCIVGIAACVPWTLAAQESRDLVTQVQIGTRIMSYEDALPQATKMLQGNLTEQKQAVTALEEYGVALKGTPALERLLEIVAKPDDFSALDEAIKASPDGKAFLTSPSGTPLANIFEIKSRALTAAVMSGSEKGIQLLNEYLAGKSVSYRLMAQDARQARERGGTWNKGKQPTKKQPRLFAYDGYGLPQNVYIEAITQALDSGKEDKLHLAITSLLGAGNASAIKGTGIFDRLFILFVKAGENFDEPKRKLRLSIIQILHSSGDKRTGEFMKAASDDKDELIRDEARRLSDD